METMTSYDNEEKKKCENCKGMFPESKIQLHEAYCRRNIRKCPDCTIFVDKNEIEEHREEFHMISACQKCGESLPTKAALIKHEDTQCRLRPRQCRFCDVKVPFQDFDHHQYTCGCRTKNCELCNKNILVRDYDIHLDTCVGIDYPIQKKVEVKKTIPDQKILSKKSEESNNLQDKQREIIESSKNQSNISSSSQPSRQVAATQSEKISYNPSKNLEMNKVSNSSGEQTGNLSGNDLINKYGGINVNAPSQDKYGVKPPSSQAQQRPQVAGNSKPEELYPKQRVPLKSQTNVPISSGSRLSNPSAQQVDAQQKKEYERLKEQNELPTQGYYDNLKTKKYQPEDFKNIPSSSSKGGQQQASSSSNQYDSKPTSIPSQSNSSKPSSYTHSSGIVPNNPQVPQKKPSQVPENISKPDPKLGVPIKQTGYTAQKITEDYSRQPSTGITGVQQTGIQSSYPYGSSRTGVVQSSGSKGIPSNMKANIDLTESSQNQSRGIANSGMSRGVENGYVPSYLPSAISQTGSVIPAKQTYPTQVQGVLSGSSGQNKPSSRGGPIQAASSSALNNTPNANYNQQQLQQQKVSNQQSSYQQAQQSSAPQNILGQKSVPIKSGYENKDVETEKKSIQQSYTDKSRGQTSLQPTVNQQKQPLQKNTSSSSYDQDDELQRAIQESMQFGNVSRNPSSGLQFKPQYDEEYDEELTKAIMLSHKHK